MEYDIDDPIPIESDYWNFWNRRAEDCLRLARFFGLLALLVALAFSEPAKAQEISNVIACDTPEQVIRYKLSDDAPATLAAINQEKAHSCALVNVSFYVGATDSTVITKDGVWQITHILVIGIVTHGGVRSVQPTVQWTAIAVASKSA